MFNYLKVIFKHVSPDQNRFNKKLKDTVGIEREKVVLDIELQDQTASAEWFFDGKKIEPSER